jgi:hypothetical protein
VEGRVPEGARGQGRRRGNLAPRAVAQTEDRPEDRDVPEEVSEIDRDGDAAGREKRRRGAPARAADHRRSEPEHEREGEDIGRRLGQEREPEARPGDERVGHRAGRRRRAQREQDESQQPEGRDEIVLRARRLEDRHGKGRRKGGGRELADAARAETPGDRGRRGEAADPGGPLQQRERAIGTGEQPQVREQDFGPGRQCQLPRDRSGVRREAPVLDPVRDARQVIGQRVPVVRRRAKATDRDDRGKSGEAEPKPPLTRRTPGRAAIRRDRRRDPKEDRHCNGARGEPDPRHSGRSERVERAQDFRAGDGNDSGAGRGREDRLAGIPLRGSGGRPAVKRHREKEAGPRPGGGRPSFRRPSPIGGAFPGAGRLRGVSRLSCRTRSARSRGRAPGDRRRRKGDRRDADFLDQMSAEGDVVLETEGGEIGADEIRPGRRPHAEAEPRELPQR